LYIALPVVLYAQLKLKFKTYPNIVRVAFQIPANSNHRIREVLNETVGKNYIWQYIKNNLLEIYESHFLYQNIILYQEMNCIL